jgi:hypothetical protein
MVGNERADIIGGRDFTRSRCVLTGSQTGDGHDNAPRIVERWQRTMKFVPQCGSRESVRLDRPYTLLCIYTSSKQTGDLPGGYVVNGPHYWAM